MSKPEIKRITCEHLVEIEKKNGEKEHLVIDIRELADYENGHIDGSVHVPKKELVDNTKSLVPENDKRVVVILGPTDEEEIEEIHQMMTDAGFKNLEYLAGGIDHYCELADIDLSDVLDAGTDEEHGFTGKGEADVDPEGNDGEPLY